jgi:hypothetical protein
MYTTVSFIKEQSVNIIISDDIKHTSTSLDNFYRVERTVQGTDWTTSHHDSRYLYPAGYDMIYLLTVIGLTPGGSSTVHIYTKTIHRTTKLIRESCRPCPILSSYTLAFALQLRKKHGKTSVRVAEECQLAQ